MGLFGSISRAIGIDKPLSPKGIGTIAGYALGGPSGALIGNQLGGMIDPKKPKSGGGGGGDAYAAQAQAGLEAAKVQANAAIKAAELNSNAAIKSSQNAALGGVLGSALGAHTTHEEIKQWLPHEVGAATIASWDLAEKWNTTLQMKTQGYSNTAIEYALQGKSGKALFADPQWNAMKMMEMSKRDVLSSVQQFGIQSAGNPYGIAMSEQDWMEMHSYKDPRSILEVDPQVAAKRQQAFSEWEKTMRAQGKGLLVDLYKNPQLGGSSILTMKGKDGLLDPALAPMLQGLMGGESKGIQMGPKETGGLQGAIANGAFSSIKGKALLPGQGGTTNWNDAINALTRGENNPMTGQIKDLMTKGVIDKYGMINAGELMKHIPPELAQPPEFNLFKELSPEEMVKLKDQYNQFATMKVDEKLIREENMGFGVTKKIKLNPDGSIASTAMQGSMFDAMGNEHFVSMSGTRLQEWYDRQSMIGGKGPLFPGMLAPVTQDQRTGRMETGFWNKNVNAAPNNGQAGFNGQFSLPNLAKPAGQASQPSAGLSKAPTASPYQAPSISKGMPQVAPLKAGED